MTHFNFVIKLSSYVFNLPRRSDVIVGNDVTPKLTAFKERSQKKSNGVPSC